MAESTTPKAPTPVVAVADTKTKVGTKPAEQSAGKAASNGSKAPKAASKPTEKPAKKAVKATVKTAVTPSAKPSAKTKTKQAATPKSGSKTAVKPGSTTPNAAVEIASDKKPARVKKEKVVRDSFTMPKSDYEKIAALKAKCLANGVHVKKGELLRAGLKLLESAELAALLAVVGTVESVKTGRPSGA